LSEQTRTEAITADVPEDSGEQAPAPSPVVAPTEPDAMTTEPEATAPVDVQSRRRSTRAPQRPKRKPTPTGRSTGGRVHDPGPFADAVDATIVERTTVTSSPAG
jgi:hypothetical protein